MVVARAAAGANAAPAGLPAISGTAQVGETLTASVSAIEDPDGLDNATFAYQWLANDGTDDSEIAGATNATYEVAPEQVGRTLKVRATFTDDKGTEETLTSAVTETVAARAPDAPGGLAVATAEGPVVTSVGLASASDGTWTEGETLGLSLTFSEPVTVATDGGTPTVGIALDGTARRASYASGSGRVAVLRRPRGRAFMPGGRHGLPAPCLRARRPLPRAGRRPRRRSRRRAGPNGNRKGGESARLRRRSGPRMRGGVPR